MSDRDKAVFKAVRGDKEHLSNILHALLLNADKPDSSLEVCNALSARLDSLQERIDALEAKRGPGRPPKG